MADAGGRLPFSSWQRVFEGCGRRVSEAPKSGSASVPQRIAGTRPPRVLRSIFRPVLKGRLGGQVCVPPSFSAASFPDDVVRRRSLPSAVVGCCGSFFFRGKQSPEHPAAEASLLWCSFVLGTATLPPSGPEKVEAVACPWLPLRAGVSGLPRQRCGSMPGGGCCLAVPSRDHSSAVS